MAEDVIFSFFQCASSVVYKGIYIFGCCFFFLVFLIHWLLMHAALWEKVVFWLSDLRRKCTTADASVSLRSRESSFFVGSCALYCALFTLPSVVYCRTSWPPAPVYNVVYLRRCFQSHPPFIHLKFELKSENNKAVKHLVRRLIRTIPGNWVNHKVRWCYLRRKWVHPKSKIQH